MGVRARSHPALTIEHLPLRTALRFEASPGIAIAIAQPHSEHLLSWILWKRSQRTLETF